MTNPALIAAMSASHAATRAARQADQTCLDAFRLADATAPGRAILPSRLGAVDGAALTRLGERGLVRDAGRGRLYLDERAVVREREATTHANPQHRRAGLALLAIALVLLGLLALLAGAGAGR